MWNPFKRKKNRHLKELHQLSSDNAILTEFNRRGLIYWQKKEKMLLIEESLALLMLSQGEDSFKIFLNKMASWQTFNLLREAYDNHRVSIEAKAVHDAQQRSKSRLDKNDIQRIRQHARETMEMLPPEKLPYVREFDILVIRAAAPSSAAATEANGQLLALGHYDGRRLEMAMYDEVKHILQKE